MSRRIFILNYFMGTKRLVRKWASDIHPGDHLCSIFETAEDQFASIADLISEGIERNEKILLLTDRRRQHVLLASLSNQAIPVTKLARQGKLVFRRAESVRGDSSSLSMILRDETTAALADGHSGLCVAWEPDRLLTGPNDSQRFAATESAAHAALSGIRCSLVCHYDRRTFPAKLLRRIIALHPMMLANPEVSGTFARGLIDQSVDGIALVDENSIIIEWNAAMAKITGVPRQLILHQNVRVLSGMMSMDPPLLGQTVGRMARKGTPFRDALAPQLFQEPFEVRLLHATARERVVQVKLFPVRLSGRVVVGALLEDVTEKRRTEQLLKDSQKELHNLASHLLAAREDDRRNVAYEIHDDLGQSLTALKMDILWLQRRLGRSGPEQEKVADMSTVVDQALTSVQRISTALRPRMLDDLGLAAAIKWLCDDFSGRTGLPCAVHINLRGSGQVENLATHIYRITQELLTNVARHAMAKRVSIELREFARSLRLIVNDNGIGITVDQVSAPESIGLIGIRERIEDLQGKFSIYKMKSGGTTARVSVPLHRKELSG